VHFAFQIMVAAGMGMLALVLLGAFVWRRKGGPERSSLFLRTATLAAPLGVIAIEAGWTVTEVGRQPWIVQGVMRVRDAVTPIGGLWIHFTGFVSVYLGLGVVVIVLLRRHLLLSTTGARDDDGAAVAGLHRCFTQHRVNTPKPVWNPDEPQKMNFFDDWEEVPDNRVHDNGFKVQWEDFIRHVVEGAPFPYTLLEGAKGVQLAELGLKSWAERRWLDVPALEV
jgi:hypothetical protein